MKEIQGDDETVGQQRDSRLCPDEAARARAARRRAASGERVFGKMVRDFGVRGARHLDRLTSLTFRTRRPVAFPRLGGFAQNVSSPFAASFTTSASAERRVSFRDGEDALIRIVRQPPWIEAAKKSNYTGKIQA